MILQVYPFGVLIILANTIWNQISMEILPYDPPGKKGRIFQRTNLPSRHGRLSGLCTRSVVLTHSLMITLLLLRKSASSQTQGTIVERIRHSYKKSENPFVWLLCHLLFIFVIWFMFMRLSVFLFVFVARVFMCLIFRAYLMHLHSIMQAKNGETVLTTSKHPTS